MILTHSSWLLCCFDTISFCFSVLGFWSSFLCTVSFIPLGISSSLLALNNISSWWFPKFISLAKTPSLDSKFLCSSASSSSPPGYLIGVSSHQIQIRTSDFLLEPHSTYPSQPITIPYSCCSGPSLPSSIHPEAHQFLSTPLPSFLSSQVVLQPIVTLLPEWSC